MECDRVGRRVVVEARIDELNDPARHARREVLKELKVHVAEAGNRHIQAFIARGNVRGNQARVTAGRGERERAAVGIKAVERNPLR